MREPMKKLFVFLAVLALGAAARLTAALHPSAGTRNGGILASQTAVRPAAMGNAYTAVADDVNSLFTNPAGLGFLKHVEILAGRKEMFEGISLSHAALTLPSGFLSAGNLDNLGTLAGAVSYLDYGGIDARDRTGSRMGLNLGAREAVINAAYGKSLWQRLAVGINVKMYYLQYSEANSKETAYDFGALYKMVPGLCTVGFAVNNLGTDIHLNQVNEPLPRAVKGGVAFTPLGERLTLAFDLVDPEDNDLRYNAGGEWWLTSLFAVRAGYDSGYDLGTGLTAGCAIRISDFEAGFFPVRRLTIDYAFTPSTELGNVHNAAITFRFGDQ